VTVEIIASYHVSHLQHCSVTERVNVTSVYPPLGFVAVCSISECCSFYPAARGKLGGDDGGSDMFHGHVCRLPCYLAAGIF
jgi:hypothetical protein